MKYCTRELYLDLLNIQNVILDSALPFFADRRSKQCRAAAYRLIRHALVDSDTVSRLRGSLDWYIVKCALFYILYILADHSSLTRSLLRDNKHAVEKEQVIKLIRTIVDLGIVRSDSAEPSGSVQLSEAVVRSVIAVAEHAEDPFRLVCIQTLTEIRMFYVTATLNTLS